MKRYDLVPVAVVCVLVYLSIVSSGYDISFFDYPWTTAGSAGTVDEKDLSIYEVSGPNMNIKTNAVLPAKLNVRYNVVAVSQLLGWNKPSMKIRYRDSGSNTSVKIKLIQVDLDTGNQTTVLTFNSNDYAQSDKYQTRSVYNCGGNKFNFQKNAYFIDAKLVKKNTNEQSSSVPGIQTIQVSSIECGFI